MKVKNDELGETINKPLLTPTRQRQRTKSLRKQYGVGTKVTFSKIMLQTSSDEIKERRKYLRQTYGFTEEEQRYIARQKPNFMLYDKHDDKGIEALSSLLKDKYGFKPELIRTLVLKHP